MFNNVDVYAGVGNSVSDAQSRGVFGEIFKINANSTEPTNPTNNCPNGLTTCEPAVYNDCVSMQDTPVYMSAGGINYIDRIFTNHCSVGLYASYCFLGDPVWAEERGDFCNYLVPDGAPYQELDAGTALMSPNGTYTIRHITVFDGIKPPVITGTKYLSCIQPTGTDYSGKGAYYHPVTQRWDGSNLAGFCLLSEPTTGAQ